MRLRLRIRQKKERSPDEARTRRFRPIEGTLDCGILLMRARHSARIMMKDGMMPKSGVLRDLMTRRSHAYEARSVA